MVLLLFGSMCGNLTYVGELVARFGEQVLPQKAAQVLIGTSGIGSPDLLLVAVVLLVVLPLCLLRHIRSIETAAMAGVLVLLAMILATITDAFRHSFGGVSGGGEPILWTWSRATPSVVGIMGFALYVHPQVIPLMLEVPPSDRGVQLVEQSIHISLFVCALLYSITGRVATYDATVKTRVESKNRRLLAEPTGVFAVLAWGEEVQPDLMINLTTVPCTGKHRIRCPQGPFAGWANLIVAIYLALSYVPSHFSLRCTLQTLVVRTVVHSWELSRAGIDRSPGKSFYYVGTVLAVLLSLVPALQFPHQAEDMFGITGATAVCSVCYVIPVALHYGMKPSAAGSTARASSPSLHALCQTPRRCNLSYYLPLQAANNTASIRLNGDVKARGRRGHWHACLKRE
eukprot:scaffold1674_cov340-Prasinococcus_capsulatus_cf.AAC.5